MLLYLYYFIYIHHFFRHSHASLFLKGKRECWSRKEVFLNLANLRVKQQKVLQNKKELEMAFLYALCNVVIAGVSLQCWCE